MTDLLVTNLSIKPKDSPMIDEMCLPQDVKWAIGKIKDELDFSECIPLLHKNEAITDYKKENNIPYIPLTQFTEEHAAYFDIYGGSFETTMDGAVYIVQLYMYKIKHPELVNIALISKFKSLFQYNHFNRENIINMIWHYFRMNTHFVNRLHDHDFIPDQPVDFSYIHTVCKTELFHHQRANLIRMLHLHANPTTVQIADCMPMHLENGLIYDMVTDKFINAEDYTYKISSGMVLDEPGTGKTLQFMLFMLHLHHESQLKSLVLVPNEDIRAVWLQEFQKHIQLPEMPFTVMTFDMVTAPLLTEFDVIGIDEIHNLYKMNHSKTSMLLNTIVDSPIKYRWGLTGTPFVNDWSLFSLIKYLAGANFLNERIANSPRLQENFRHLFLKNRKIDMTTIPWAEVIVQDIYVELDIVQRRLYDAERMLNSKTNLRKLICDINLMFEDNHITTPEELKSYGMKRYKKLFDAEHEKLEGLKSQINHIIEHPEGFTQDEYRKRIVHFEELIVRQTDETEKHRRVCEYFMNSIDEINKITAAATSSAEAAEDETSSENNCSICWGPYTMPILYFKNCGHYFCKACLEPMRRASQGFNCPMCRKEIRSEDTICVHHMTDINNSSKIHELLKIVKPDEKYIIFTQFPSVIDRIQSFLERNKMTSATLADYTDETILLLSSEQNAEGINLSHIDNMIIFEPFEDTIYSNEVEKQLVARIHRVGRVKPVNIYRFITKDTIEEDIYKNCSVF